MIPLFDLHCDTLLSLYKENFTLDSSPLHISNPKTSNFSPYTQVMAIWSDCRLSSKDAYNQYKNVIEYAKRLNINFARKFSDILNGGKILAIEDGRIIENDISRLEEFKNDGVKIITLSWSGINQICGSWDTDASLSEFGKSFVEKCFELSIIPDISHTSVEATKNIIELARKHNKTIIASHSNSYSVCKHGRNLRDDDFKAICELGGIVGISLAPQHMEINGNATIECILKHIGHYLSLGGENSICLGCDFDGVSSLPYGISDISDLTKLYDAVKIEFGDRIAYKIFYRNAFEFFKNNF